MPWHDGIPMKQQYQKVLKFRAKHNGDFYYEWTGSGYYRPIGTFSEVRQNTGDANDFQKEEIKCRVRAKRSMRNLDPWQDFARSQNYGKSWKQYTRHRKQWMVKDDPKPHKTPERGWVYTLLRDFDPV